MHVEINKDYPNETKQRLVLVVFFFNLYHSKGFGHYNLGLAKIQRQAKEWEGFIAE